MVRNIAERFNRLSRVHERYRQTDDRQADRRTDGRQHNSERKGEFAFAENDKYLTCRTGSGRNTDETAR